jgi:Mrp family chromosome partitioning ATPase
MSRIETALRKAETLEIAHLRTNGTNGAARKNGFGAFGSNVPHALMDNLRREIRGTRRPVLGVCSLRRGEGTSTLAAYLAIQFALDKQVLAVDCSLATPQLHDLLGTGEGPGVSEILLGEKRVQDCILPVAGRDTLSLLPAGRCGGDALPFLGTPYSARVFEEVKQEFDVVLVDAPSDETFSGTLGLCLQTEGVVWVIGSGNEGERKLRETLNLYQEAGVRLLGGVINRATLSTF